MHSTWKKFPQNVFLQKPQKKRCRRQKYGQIMNNNTTEVVCDWWKFPLNKVSTCWENATVLIFINNVESIRVWQVDSRYQPHLWPQHSQMDTMEVEISKTLLEIEIRRHTLIDF